MSDRYSEFVQSTSVAQNLGLPMPVTDVIDAKHRLPAVWFLAAVKMHH